jgi:hypothetical protein
MLMHRIALQGLDIGSIVSQRLTAMRKLQENPNDVQALSEMYRAQKDVCTYCAHCRKFHKVICSGGRNKSSYKVGYEI